MQAYKARGCRLPTPLSIALQAGLVCVLRELAEARDVAASWGASTCEDAVRARWVVARRLRNAALMVTYWRQAGVDLGDGA